MREIEGKKSAKVDTSGRKTGGLKRTDSVTITAHSEEAKKARALYDKLPEIRKDLVDELKGKVESGEYDVSSKEVADKIIHRAVVDKSV